MRSGAVGEVADADVLQHADNVAAVEALRAHELRGERPARNEEVQQLTDFVENALYDPDLMRYVPDSLPSKLCFPNNDTQTRVDLNFGQ